MKVYIAGPMTGLPEFNYPNFHAAADRLRVRGYTVVNPAEHDGLGETWEQYMRLAIAALIDCDGLALLDGWDRSRGALLEIHIAEHLGIPIAHIDDWQESAA